MRALLVLLCTLPFVVALAGQGHPPLAAGTEPPALADATLHALRMIDANEGWAVGDEGLILHTIDGGKTWERQPSGTRASLRDLHFIDAFTGFAVGREELPYSGGSAGVLLHTDDGGLKWRTLSVRTMPGLNGIRFADDHHGYLLADGSDALPTGLFETQDGGSTWKMVPGHRQPAWWGGAFQPGPRGIVAGSTGMMQFNRKTLGTLTTPPTNGRAIRCVNLNEQQGCAVGDLGLVWTTKNGGISWQEVAADSLVKVAGWYNFRAICRQGNHLWIAGRPGTMIFHSPNGGQTWEQQATGQPLGITQLQFVDEMKGWAVGQAGLILATTDGGQNWQVQRRGAHKAAVLIITSQKSTVPLETIASLGADEGYLVNVLQVTSPDASAPPTELASAESRLHEAVRRAGGCLAEVLPGFPLPQHLAETDAASILKFWGKGDEKSVANRLQQQIVQALDRWQPDVVLMESTDPRISGTVGAIVAQAACGACVRSEVRGELRAPKPWQPLQVYEAVANLGEGQITLDLDNVRPLLGASASDVATTARPLLRSPQELPPQLAHYKLVVSNVAGAERHTTLMQGSTLGRGGQARRPERPFDPQEFEVAAKLSQERREAMRAVRRVGTNPDQFKACIAAVEGGTAQLEEEAAGEVVFLLGQQFVAQGQWPQAREVFLMLLDRYPSHPLATEANNWLIAFTGSSAAKRREELKQFGEAMPYNFAPTPKVNRRNLPTNATQLSQARTVQIPQTLLQREKARVREWYQGSQVMGELLAVQGVMPLADPRVQFSLQASQRQLHQDEAAKLWYTQFMVTQAGGPWFDAAAAELWLPQPEGNPCPKPLIGVRPTPQPPVLDGQFTESCWTQAQPLKLKDAVGQTIQGQATEVRMAYDDNFLYLAITCRQPQGVAGSVPKKQRQRDDDLRGQDRIAILLDTDRSYATPFRLEVDQRGCVREECWGDAKWDAKWFVAAESTATGYQIEAAIPLTELSGLIPTPGTAWAVNIVRTLPGQGVQAFSLPADVEVRPEGLGLLRFEAAAKRP